MTNKLDKLEKKVIKLVREKNGLLVKKNFCEFTKDEEDRFIEIHNSIANLAYQYYEQAVKKNKKFPEANDHLYLAFEHNHPQAIKLIHKILKKQDEKCSKQQTQQQTAEGQDLFLQGLACLTGIGRRGRNESSALACFRTAEKNGDEKAQFLLGLIYRNAFLGVKGNNKTAFGYFKKAAENGYAMANHYQAVCFLDGKGVSQNMREALKCLDEAADQGNARAFHELGKIYSSPGWGKFSPQAAYRYLNIAIRLGYVEAYCSLARLHRRGVGGVPSDLKKAARQFRRALEKGHSTAIISLRNGKNIYYKYHTSMGDQNYEFMPRLLMAHPELINEIIQDINDFSAKPAILNRIHGLFVYIDKFGQVDKQLYPQLFLLLYRQVFFCLSEHLVCEKKSRRQMIDMMRYCLQNGDMPLIEIDQIPAMVESMERTWYAVKSEHKYRVLRNQAEDCLRQLIYRLEGARAKSEVASEHVWQISLILVKSHLGKKYEPSIEATDFDTLFNFLTLCEKQPELGYKAINRRLKKDFIRRVTVDYTAVLDGLSEYVHESQAPSLQIMKRFLNENWANNRGKEQNQAANIIMQKLVKDARKYRSLRHSHSLFTIEDPVACRIYRALAHEDYEKLNELLITFSNSHGLTAGSRDIG